MRVFWTVIALGIAIISRGKGLTRNLQAFLYGDPLAVTDAELLWMAALFLLVSAYLAFLYNRILLLGIHEGFARTKGVRVPAVEISFALVVALVVTAAIRAVGILLVTALLVVPAAAARNVARGAASALWVSVGIAVLPDSRGSSPPGTSTPPPARPSSSPPRPVSPPPPCTGSPARENKRPSIFSVAPRGISL